MYQPEVAYAGASTPAPTSSSARIPHRLKAIEVYKGKPIFYSLGNFCFDQPRWVLDEGRRRSPEHKAHMDNYGWTYDPEYEEWYAVPAGEPQVDARRRSTSSTRRSTGSRFLPIMINKRAQPEILKSRRSAVRRRRHATSARSPRARTSTPSTPSTATKSSSSSAESSPYRRTGGTDDRLSSTAFRSLEGPGRGRPATRCGRASRAAVPQRGDHRRAAVTCRRTCCRSRSCRWTARAARTSRPVRGGRGLAADDRGGLAAGRPIGSGGVSARTG